MLVPIKVTLNDKFFSYNKDVISFKPNIGWQILKTRNVTEDILEAEVLSLVLLVKENSIEGSITTRDGEVYSYNTIFKTKEDVESILDTFKALSNMASSSHMDALKQDGIVDSGIEHILNYVFKNKGHNKVELSDYIEVLQNEVSKASDNSYKDSNSIILDITHSIGDVIFVKGKGDLVISGYRITHINNVFSVKYLLESLRATIDAEFSVIK